MNMKDERLCREVERALGREMRTPQDFVWLSEQICAGQRNTLSVNTLKRFWGYIDSGHAVTRQSTYDILAQFVGFRDYTVFCQQQELSGENSNAVLSRSLNTRTLAPGLKIRVTWLPDRELIAEHKGRSRFVITSVMNSKLTVGDSFECALLIENEPLYLSNLMHEGNGPVAYVAGKQNGIRFEIVED